ncbi:hypothetical protein GCM10022229_22920 [Luteimonas lutimaris]|uniref:HNH nuclease domain-containing protein n=1 Tax=Luteimonas lutimaris TaxID=698645 RepID=A0ABP7MU05_9GAMM
MQRRPTRPSGRDADPRRTIPLGSYRWQRLRAAVLARDPLCRDCKHPATDVDHDDGDPSNNAPHNLVPRCHSCHSIKTMREQHGTHGCDESGWPRDPSSHWNEKIAGS